MARDPHRPISLESLIRWHLDRGSSRATVLDRTRYHYGSSGVRRFAGLWNRIGADYSAAGFFTRASGRYLLDTSAYATRYGPFSGYRFGVRISFDNPRTRRRETRGYRLDLPAGLTKDQILERIRGSIVDTLAGQYQIQIGGRGGLSSRVRGVEVTSTEGL